MLGLSSVIGSVIGAGVNLYQGHKQRKQENRQFDAQMDQTIQRRVADAKAAGVHPLYALGASSGASPTVSSKPQAGGHIAQAGKSIDQAALMSAQIKAAEGSANKDNAIANLENSRAALLKSGAAARGRDQFSSVNAGPPLDAVSGTGGHTLERPRVMAARPSNPGVEAGDRPSSLKVIRLRGSLLSRRSS